jgi:hypothetical protein
MRSYELQRNTYTGLAAVVPYGRDALLAYPRRIGVSPC